MTRCATQCSRFRGNLVQLFPQPENGESSGEHPIAPGTSGNQREKSLWYRRRRGIPPHREPAVAVLLTQHSVMSNHFHCLLGNMQLDANVATDVVLACCILHNFWRLRCGKGYIPDILATKLPEAPTVQCDLVPIYLALGR